MAVDQKPFYGRRGGVTFSGGEPTFQAAALAPLVRRLREAGIHVCIDTNGSIWNPAVEELLGLADLILLDVKQADPERHLALTERDNAQTLRTAAWLEEHGKPFWLRYVLVPGYSDAEADIRTLGGRLGGYRQIERVELLPLPHARSSQIRSDGKGVQTLGRQGEYAGTAGPRGGAVARIFRECGGELTPPADFGGGLLNCYQHSALSFNSGIRSRV